MNLLAPFGFATGDALRTQLRGSAALQAEAAASGETEERALERLVAIAERARLHHALVQLQDPTP